MGRSPCCSKENMNRGAWTTLEDKILTDYINLHGEGRWRNVPQLAGLKRCGKSCRLRWLNYLRPGIKRGNISQDEEELIIRLHKLLGNRWSLIAGRLPGRTDNEIKNYWNTHLGKNVQQLNQKKPTTVTKMPIDPIPLVVRAKAVKCNKVVLRQVIGQVGLRDRNNDVENNPGKVSEDTLDISNFVNPELGASLGQVNQDNIVETLSADIGDLDLDELFLSDLILMNTGIFPHEDCNSTYCSANNYIYRDADVLKEKENVGLESNYFASSLFDGASEGDWLAAV